MKCIGTKEYDYSSTINLIGKIYNAEDCKNGIKLSIGIYYNDDILIYHAYISKRLYNKKISRDSANKLMYFIGTLLFKQIENITLGRPNSIIEIYISDCDYIE